MLIHTRASGYFSVYVMFTLCSRPNVYLLNYEFCRACAAFCHLNSVSVSNLSVCSAQIFQLFTRRTVCRQRRVLYLLFADCLIDIECQLQ